MPGEVGVDGVIKAAAGLYAAGRFAEAGEAYREVLRTAPNHFEALRGLGIVCLQAENFAEAERVLGDALRINPGYADGWYARGGALLRLGQAEEAIGCFDRALALKPDYVEAASARAGAFMQLNRPEEALAGLDRLLALTPSHANSWNNRGNVLASLQCIGEALESFDRALEINPNFLEAMTNRSIMQLELQRFDEALLGVEAALAIAPDHPAVWNNRGNVLLAMKRFEEAVASYDKALALGADFPQAIANRDNALLELRRVSRCPDTYIRNLFDEFSPTYDRTMLEKLGYRAHLHLRTLADRVLPAKRGWRVLDLGSGTGLVGDAFKDLAAGGRLDGIDLAPQMIEAARRRAIYDELILGEIETVLHAPGPAYDLALAADTMIYFGELGPTLSGLAKRLAPSGFYIFAVEAKTGDGWEQTPMNRFRHSEGYLRTAAERAGLEVVDIMDCVLRHESNQPVAGFAVALRRPTA